ncbi:MAG: ABC transporter permease subunit [Clostridia bacterium]|nr:ABC transporter permease subunit [Clostridia bacterium]
MFKQKCDDFLVYDEATDSYSMPADQQVRDTVEKNKWKDTLFTILKDWRLYIMLVPMIVVYVLWRYMPMYELLGCFKNPSIADSVSDQYWVGLRYFYDIMFGDAEYSVEFWLAFRNTFVTAFYGLLFGFPVPIILALFFNEVRSNVARNIMQVCVYLPKFLSTVIVTTLALVLFKGSSSGDYGVVSKLLVWFGVDETLAKAGLVYTTQYYRGLYVVLDLWEHAGYDSIVFFAAVIAISPTSYEAAQIDGAGKMQQMRYVVIPSILSTVVIMLIMKIGSLLSVGYEKIYLLMGSNTIALEDGSYYTTSNYEAANTVSTWANQLSDYSDYRQAYGKAAEMLNNLIGMILVIGSNAIAKRATDVSLY